MPLYLKTEIDYNIFKLKKIKFPFLPSYLNKVLLNYKNIGNLEEISGLVITKKNIKQWIEKINNMENLKKISKIKFGEFCERCGAHNFERDGAEIVCGNCGLVNFRPNEDIEEDEIQSQIVSRFFHWNPKNSW